MSSYAVMDEVVQALLKYKRRHKLSFGMYVQEPDIDFQATTVLMNLANTNGHIFDLGKAIPSVLYT
jgi:hypothetical protein